MCNQWFCAEAFDPHQRDYRSTHTRVCIGCKEKRQCISCEEWKYKPFFTNSEWDHANRNDGQGKCKVCSERSAVGEWYCKGCQARRPKMEFSQWIETHGPKQYQTARCNPCREKHEAEQKRMRQANQAMVIPSAIQPSLSIRTQTQLSCNPMVHIFVVGVIHQNRLS